MMGYTKLFNELIMSTIWRENDKTRLLWITILALRDRWHRVSASVPGLADVARITVDECESGLKILSSPDPYSRSRKEEGRRILPIDGGWYVVNGEEYAQRMSLDERREYQRIKQKEYYAKKNKNGKKPLQKSVQSSSSSQGLTHIDIDRDKDTTTNVVVSRSATETLTWVRFSEFWKAYPNKMGVEAAKAVWKKIKPTAEVHGQILAGIEKYKKSKLWRDGFIASPAKWLSEGRWQDDIELAWEYTDDEGENAGGNPNTF